MMRGGAWMLAALTIVAGCTFPGWGEREVDPTWRVVEAIAPENCELVRLEAPCMILEVETMASTPRGAWSARYPDGSALWRLDEVPFIGSGPVVEAGERRSLLIEAAEPGRISLAYELFDEDATMLVPIDAPVRREAIEPYVVRDVRVAEDPLGCWRAQNETCYRIAAEADTRWGVRKDIRASRVIGTDGFLYFVKTDAADLNASVRLRAGAQPAILLADVGWAFNERTLEVPLGPTAPRAPREGEVTSRLVEATAHDACPEAAFGWTCLSFAIEVGNGLDGQLGIHTLRAVSDAGASQHSQERWPDVAPFHAAIVRGETVLVGSRGTIGAASDIPPVIVDVAGAGPGPREPILGARFRVEGWNLTQACDDPPCMRVDARLQAQEYAPFERLLLVDPSGAVRDAATHPRAQLEPPADIPYSLTYLWRGEGEPRFLAADERPVEPGAWHPVTASLRGQSVPSEPWPLALRLAQIRSVPVEDDIVQRTLDVVVRSSAAQRLPLAPWYEPIEGEDSSYMVVGGIWNVTTIDGSRWPLSPLHIRAIEPGGETLVRLALETRNDTGIATIEFAGETLALEPISRPPPADARVVVEDARIERLGPALARVHLQYRLHAADEIAIGPLALRTDDGARYLPTRLAGPELVAPDESAVFHAHYTIASWARPVGLEHADETIALPPLDADVPPSGPLAVWRLPDCKADALCLRIGYTAQEDEHSFTSEKGELVAASGRRYATTPPLAAPSSYALGSWGVVDVEMPRDEVPARFTHFWLFREGADFPPSAQWRKA